MSSFLHEMEEACSHSLKKPSDKSHKADHNCGKSHFIHNSFQIFTSDLQRELSWLGCVAVLCQSSHCWHGSDSLVHIPRSAKPEELLPRRENGIALWRAGVMGSFRGLLCHWCSGFLPALPPGTQAHTDLHCFRETFHAQKIYQCYVSSTSLDWRDLSHLAHVFWALRHPLSHGLLSSSASVHLKLWFPGLHSNEDSAVPHKKAYFSPMSYQSNKHPFLWQ